jgi:hypothetical protein
LAFLAALSAATRGVHERNMRKMQCKSDIALGNRYRDLLLGAWSHRGVQAALAIDQGCLCVLRGQLNVHAIPFRILPSGAGLTPHLRIRS